MNILFFFFPAFVVKVLKHPPRNRFHKLKHQLQHKLAGHHYFQIRHHQVRNHRKNQSLKYHHTIQVKNQNQVTHHFEQRQQQPQQHNPPLIHQVNYTLRDSISISCFMLKKKKKKTTEMV